VKWRPVVLAVGGVTASAAASLLAYPVVAAMRVVWRPADLGSDYTSVEMMLQVVLALAFTSAAIGAVTGLAMRRWWRFIPQLSTVIIVANPVSTAFGVYIGGWAFVSPPPEFVLPLLLLAATGSMLIGSSLWLTSRSSLPR